MVEVTVEFVVDDSAIFLVYRKSYGGHNLDTGHWDPGLLCLICTLYAFTPKNRFRKATKAGWERGGDGKYIIDTKLTILEQGSSCG